MTKDEARIKRETEASAHRMRVTFPSDLYISQFQSDLLNLVDDANEVNAFMYCIRRAVRRARTY